MELENLAILGIPVFVDKRLPAPTVMLDPNAPRDRPRILCDSMENLKIALDNDFLKKCGIEQEPYRNSI